MAEPPLSFRSVFISDVHLGSSACRVEEFNEFLHTFTCERMYLVGDIIDVWVVVKSGKWKQAHTNAIRSILGKSKHGCSIYYTPGNHDTFLRKVNNVDLGNISLSDTFVHEMTDGRRLLVIHGDQYDSSVNSFFLAFAGTWVYEIMMARRLARRSRQQKPAPSRGGIKHKFKKIISTFGNYEEKLLLAAQTLECDGVVCGHIHRPALYEKDGLLYGNCGDWVENNTVLIEHHDGKMELATWEQVKAWAADPPRHELALMSDPA